MPDKTAINKAYRNNNKIHIPIIINQTNRKPEKPNAASVVPENKQYTRDTIMALTKVAPANPIIAVKTSKINPKNVLDCLFIL